MAQDVQIREYYSLKCPKCKLHHSTFSELKKHYRKKHYNINSIDAYVICCDKRLYTRSELLNHILCHSNPDEFK